MTLKIGEYEMHGRVHPILLFLFMIPSCFDIRLPYMCMFIDTADNTIGDFELYMYTVACACVHAHTHTHIHAHSHTHTHTHTHAHTHTRTQTHTHTHTHRINEPVHIFLKVVHVWPVYWGPHTLIDPIPHEIHCCTILMTL